MDNINICNRQATESRHAGIECAYCGKVIAKERKGTSTPEGSMHNSCARKREREHPEDW
jgi:hypothetical protein